MINREVWENPVPKAEEEPSKEPTVLDNFTKYDQQCIMLKEFVQFKDRLDLLRSANETIGNYKNISSLKINSAEEAQYASNIVHSSEKFEPFINIPNHIIPALIPKIRIYKSYILEDGQKFDLEIPLEDHIKEEDILGQNIGRSFGYGLQQFSWENTSFNEVDRNISANLILKFANMDAFTKVRKGIFAGDTSKVQDPQQYQNFRFLELLYQVPSKVNSTEAKNINDLKKLPGFKIKVAVGWMFEDAVLDELEYSGDRTLLKEAIRANNYILYLYYKGHDINISNNGTITVTVNFQSAQEALITNDSKSNVLARIDLMKKLDEKVEKFNEQVENKKETFTGKTEKDVNKDLERIEKERSELQSSSNFEIYSNFIDGLFERKFIKLFEVREKDIEKFKNFVFPVTQEQKDNQSIKIFFNTVSRLEPGFQQEKAGQIKQLLKPGATPSEDTSAEELRKLLITKQEGRIIVPYFYLGDLLDYVLEISNSSAVGEEKINLLLGSFVYERIKKNAIKNTLFFDFDEWKEENDKAVSIITSLGDIPISLEGFLAWIQEEIVSRRRSKMSLKTFLSTFLNKFLVGALTPTAFGQQFIVANPKIDMHIFNAVESGGQDPLHTSDGQVTLEQISTLDQAKKYENTENLKVIPYLYVQVFYSDVEDRYVINEAKNSRNGIYHLKVGIDRGLTKEINFSKDDMPSMAVLNYSQQGTLNPQVLRAPYNAEVKMIGNTVFKPGSMVYVDPSFTLSIPDTKSEMITTLDEIGLGGFYIVVRTNNSISPGKFSTTMACRFTNYGKRE